MQQLSTVVRMAGELRRDVRERLTSFATWITHWMESYARQMLQSMHNVILHRITSFHLIRIIILVNYKIIGYESHLHSLSVTSHTSVRV